MLQLICILLLNIVYTQWMVKSKDLISLLFYFMVQVVLIWQTLTLPNEMLEHLAL